MRIIAFASAFTSPHTYTPCLMFLDERRNIQNHARKTSHDCLNAASSYHHTVSGSFHILYGDPFQFSLTVLVCYRSWHVFRVRSWCLPYSQAISNARYSWTLKYHLNFDYGTITLFCVPFQETSSNLIMIKIRAAPHLLNVSIKDSVCSNFRVSIAFTNRIAFAFFSCG